MKRNNNNIIYTAKDIEQYLSGNLSPLQMHAMEKAAQDDPLLAEAMEGYEAMQGSKWNDQLAALRKEIADKGSVAKVIPLHKTKNNWGKIAAAAIFIIGAGTALTYVLTTNNGDEKNTAEIAQTFPGLDTTVQTTPEPEPSVTASLNPTATKTKEELITANGPVNKSATVLPGMAQIITASPKEEPLALRDNNNAGAVPDNTKLPPPSAPVSSNANNNAQLSEVVSDGLSKQSSRVDDDEVVNRQRNLAKSSTKKEAVLNNYFTAQVVGPDNTPLPFTNISIKKDNFGTYADAKGMVRLISTDSILNVEVRSVGYLPKVYALRNNQAQTKIVLQEDEMAQKDKVVIGRAQNNNQRSRRATLLTDSVINVEPADGWENYNTYVANNLDIPEDMLKRDIRGEVELSFEVKKNGTITNLKVNKSMGAEYDDAAKRLIMEGPQWRVKKGRKTSASIKVQF